MTESAPPFFDVPMLLEQSVPQPRNSWMKYGSILFMVLVLASAVVGRQSPESAAAAGDSVSLSPQQIMGLLGSLTMILLMVGMGFITVQSIKRQRDEQRQIESIEELIQLRRWPQAAMMLVAMLSVPARSVSGRIQALLYLSSVLARYHRFHDVVEVQEHILETVEIDPVPAYALRLSRAMALLHEDQLLDADRAISEMRRLAGGVKTAGLLLVEIYRDVKTGHADEAVALFTEYQTLLRDQLGHRVADVWALVAKAYDQLERTEEAKTAYRNALILAPEIELQRRYPEVATLKGKYPAAQLRAGIAPLTTESQH